MLAVLSQTPLRYPPDTNADSSLGQCPDALATLYPRSGYLLLHGLLCGKGRVKNRKRTYCLYNEEGLQVRT